VWRERRRTASGLAGADGVAGVGEDLALLAPLPLVLAGRVGLVRDGVHGAGSQVVGAIVGAADGVAGVVDAGTLGAPLPVLLFLGHGAGCWGCWGCMR
jgi:hypothetical protein